MRQSLRVVAATVALSLSGGVAVAQKLVAPVRGNAKVEITKPETKVSAKEIVTTFRLRNIESAPIAGLKVEENWYDKSGNPVMGDTFRNPKPLQPGEVVTITFKTPRTATVQASSPLTVIAMTAFEFRRLEAEHPDIAATIRERIQERKEG